METGRVRKTRPVFENNMRFPLVTVKTVLVTGCSSGIGLATARTLRDHGWNVRPTARRKEHLEQLRSEGFTPLELDVSDSAAVQRAADDVLRGFNGQLGALVNNAGFGQPGAMEDLTREAMRYQFEVNFFGLQELTNRFIPVFRKQGYGRIVNISSVVGRISLPFMGIYSASKHAVEAVSDAMRIELLGSGISVSIIEPGPINTRFRDNSLDRARSQLDKVKSHFQERYLKQVMDTNRRRGLTAPFAKTPEAVALKILHALESPNPRRRYPVTFPAYLGEIARRFFPDSIQDFFMRRRLS